MLLLSKPWNNTGHVWPRYGYLSGLQRRRSGIFIVLTELPAVRKLREVDIQTRECANARLVPLHSTALGQGLCLFLHRQRTRYPPAHIDHDHKRKQKERDIRPQEDEKLEV